MKISISLERNNISKTGRVENVLKFLKIFNKDSVTEIGRYTTLGKLSKDYKAAISESSEYRYIVILDSTGMAVGGVEAVVGGSLVLQGILLTKPAQGKGLMLALLEILLKKYGAINSSDSISPGAALLFKKLAERHKGYIIWRHANTYAEISAWLPAGIYKVFPHIRAPDGKDYAVDKLEEALLKTRASTAEQYRHGEIFVSLDKKPPSNFKRIA